MTKQKNSNPNFSGYDQSAKGHHDRDLAETGPGTLSGEYLRRYWQPVALTKDLGEKPKLIKILGEELILFKNQNGQFGLVHKHCPHRRASLEFGHCDEKGIRCCYHGWLFGIDGTILEIPGEPVASSSAESVMQNTKLGAYPLKEFRGLIFAYMGPIQEIPEFPMYDAYSIEGMVMSPYQAEFKCNWIQVLDAIVDPVHTAFLHQKQFTDGFGMCGEFQFYERDKIRFLGTNTRRVGDNAWVRVNELILPNFTQSGAAFASDGTQTRYFGRSSFTRWVVPIDDENCIAFAWGNFGERGDPHEFNTKEGMERIEQGEIIDRTYEEKQQSPGDVEAVEGMGRISEHSKENLVSGDRGIIQYRRRIRRLVKDLANGIAPPQPFDLNSDMVLTYGSDTVVKAPVENIDEDHLLLRQINDQVMDILFFGDDQPIDKRDNWIIQQLKTINNKNSSHD